MKKNNNKCEECYKNGKIPSDIDCAKCDEVIIDDCNVAECDWMIDGKDVIGCKSYICCCEEINNCYFKQLQRAKAELEQYKKSKQASYEGMQKEWNYAINTLRDVEAANEKLKNALIEIKVNFINQSARNGLSKFENEIFIKIDKVLSP